jgi:hypothetical protein
MGDAGQRPEERRYRVVGARIGQVFGVRVGDVLVDDLQEIAVGVADDERLA